MDESQTPECWELPNWHLDYGDVRAEFQQLRSFALSLLSSVPNVSVALAVPEAGLMFVRVYRGSVCIAEIYSVESHGNASARRLAIFTVPESIGGDEIYATSIVDAVGHVAKAFQRTA